MEPQFSLPPAKTKTMKSKSAGISDAFIVSALAIIIMILVFNWMASYDSPPEQDDLSEFSDPYDAYQNALENHQDKIRGFEGMSSLFSSMGVVLLVGGLFYKSTRGQSLIMGFF